AAGIQVEHIPHKGGPEATTDTMTGRVTYWFPPPGLALPYLRDGRLLALGVSTVQRSVVLPDVPTIMEAGVNFQDAIWYGIWAPAGVPPALVKKIAADVERALNAADVREQHLRAGAEAMRKTP